MRAIVDGSCYCVCAAHWKLISSYQNIFYDKLTNRPDGDALHLDECEWMNFIAKKNLIRSRSWLKLIASRSGDRRTDDGSGPCVA